VKRSFAQLPSVTSTAATGLGDVSDRVRAGIAIKRRIARTAYTDRIEDEDDSSWHLRVPESTYDGRIVAVG
jgi:hypothetical protein